MWTVLAPLLLFVLVLLFQLGRQTESFQTDASGNTVDASGNTVDASGNTVKSSASPSLPLSTNIQLSFSDLLKLFKASAPTPPVPPPSRIDPRPIPPESPRQLYEKLRPAVLFDIKSHLQGAPFEPADPIPSSTGCGMSSDSIAQGVELMHAKSSLEDNSDYIRKDSIPCFGCSL